MKYYKLIFKSLLFYWRTNLGVLFGTAISTAIIVGALVVGDSVRYSLRQITFDRLSRVEYAMTAGDRFFRSALANELADQLSVETSAVLNLTAIAISDGGNQRANGVQVLGIQNDFWEMSESTIDFPELETNEAIVNERLAAKLNLQTGDEFLLRVEKSNYLPRETPLVSDENISIAIQLKIKGIALKEQMGNFSLKANQVAPYNIFLSRVLLTKEMELSDLANMLLVAANEKEKVSLETLNTTLKNKFKLADAGLKLRYIPELKTTELVSERIFIEKPISDFALKASTDANGIFTYFVNQFRKGEKTTPYSFVSAPGKSIVPGNMSDKEIIINQWLAKDLSATKGDSIELTYFSVGDSRRLDEKSTSFCIRDIIPISGAAADRNLMPAFPGLVNEENCRDWDPGIPIDLDKIRDKDEKYWDDYRGTPKAFVALSAAQKLWANRFGNLTAIRYPDLGTPTGKIVNNITNNLDPASLGMIFLPVRELGLRSSSESTDFGQLFLGLSFFIVVAAVLLTGLLFVFGVEFRSAETGLYLALGFNKVQVKKLILGEGILISVFGSVVGTILGVLYNQFVLYGLSTLWKGAVGTSALQLNIQFSTILVGAFSGIVVSLLAMWLAIRKLHTVPVSELQQSMDFLSSVKKGRFKFSLILTILSFIGVLAILLMTDPGRGKEAAGAFFGAGSLLLIGGLALANVFFVRSDKPKSLVKISISSLGFRNVSRKRGRSLATIGILACGIFIVVAVGANRKSSIQNAEQRDSGTGGFALFAETSIPFVGDLNSEKDRRQLGLEKGEGSVVQMRLREGEDASCLNLNRVQSPKILGIKPEEFSSRGAFSFVKISEEVDKNNPWLVLNQKYDNNTIPAIADQTVIVWGLGKSVGDTLMYRDESGRQLNLKLVGGLANSVFQGHVIVSEAALLQAFPSSSGYRVFLIDTPFEKSKTLAENFSWALSDYGIQLSTTSERLAAFNTIENTYLSIFLALGGLGLILGSIGMGVVVMRNILERRNELALLNAVGFQPKSIRLLLVSEYWLLLVIGLIIGVITAGISAFPAILSPGTEIPYSTIVFLLAAVLISGGFWPLLATKLASRRNILTDLRNE
jgi:putative ABC transport system permease protein